MRHLLVIDQSNQHFQLIGSILQSQFQRQNLAENLDQALSIAQEEEVHLLMMHFDQFQDKRHPLIALIKAQGIPWIYFDKKLPHNRDRLNFFEAGATGFLLTEEFPTLLSAKAQAYVKLSRNQAFPAQENPEKAVQPSLFFELDKDAHILSMGENHLCLSPETSLGKNFSELLAPESRACFQEAMTKATTDLGPREIFLTLPTPLGSQFEKFHFRITPMGAKGLPKSYILSGISTLRQSEEFAKLQDYKETLEDMVERRSEDLRQANKVLLKEIRDKEFAEESLKRQQELIGELLDGLPVGIFLQDHKGRMTLTNREANKIFGSADRSIIGKTYFDLFDPSIAEAYRQEDVTILESGQPLTKEECINSEESKSYYIFGRCPIKIRGDEPVILGFRLCIDNRKKLEEQLFQSRKMEAVGTMAGGIAHDFNNLLFAMMLNINLARQDNPIPEGQTDFLQKAQLAGEKAKELILQILSFSRRDDKNYQPLDLVPIIEESCKIIESGLLEGIELKADLRLKEAICLLDPTQMHQVLLNLCGNAAYALKDKKGQITVSLDRVLSQDYPSLQKAFAPGELYKISVQDQGEGIPEELKEKIFDPFFTTKPPGEGSGMGLSVVHGIVKKHHGVISCSSDQEGTTFDIFLPIAQNDLYISNKPTSKNEKDINVFAKLKGLRLLFVDDQEMIVEAEQIRLESLGFQVTPTTSAKRALQLLKEAPYAFDLMITDLTMPIMSGDDLAKEALKIKPDLKIILTTGFPSHEGNKEFLDIGINAILIKPVLLDRLQQTLGDLFSDRLKEPTT